MSESETAIIEETLLHAKKQGWDAETFLQRSSSTRIQVRKGEVEQFSLADTTGLGLRVLRESRVGYAFTEDLTRASALRALEEAATNARLLPVSEHVQLGDFAGAPLPTLNLYNPQLDTIPMADKIAWALELERTCYETDDRVKNVTSAGFSDSRGQLRVANTRGLDRSYAANMAWMGCMPLASEHDQNKNHYKSRASRDLSKLVPGQLAREAVKETLRKLNAREINSGNYPVVFKNEAFADLLGVFNGIFSGKLAQEGKSLLAGRLGQTVASPAFTLTDDPLLVEGFAARPFDDEGFPSRALPLIKEGVFQAFLHNSQTARRAGILSSGHASRSYAGTVGVSPSNLVVKPGLGKAEALLSKGDTVLLVTEITGLHAGANAISGDFSLQAQGFLHDGGQERHPIHNFTVAGNFFELLTRIQALGDDVEVFPGTPCIVTPSVLISELAIAGK